MASETLNDSAVADCQQRLGYDFDDPSLLESALVHSSSATHRLESNERMEFLGDAVLGLVVCQELYERLPDALEGDLTKIKSAVVSRRVCAKVANRLDLTDWLRLGQGMTNGHHMPKSLAAAALEAIVAAIYLDGGLEAAREWILRQFEPELSAAIESDNQSNYKSQLQQYAQRQMRSTPIYEMLDEKGPDHAKCFEIAVSIGSQTFASAWGPSKKEAEQKAALQALLELGVVAENSEEELVARA